MPGDASAEPPAPQDNDEVPDVPFGLVATLSDADVEMLQRAVYTGPGAKQ